LNIASKTYKPTIIMKTLFFIASLLVCTLGFAKENENFKFKETEISETFDRIDALEQYIIANPTQSAASIVAEKPNLIDESIDLSPTNVLDTQRDLPLVSPFWWGCCLGVIGLIVVYVITDNDRGQVKSAFWGCLISTLLFGGGLLRYLDVF
jgi:hypothetical protein